MKNKKPIILNCFSRGGSNLLWNIFLSHPDVCSPNRETLEIFDFNLRAPKLSGIKTLFYTRDIRFFNQWNLKDRKKVSMKTKSFINDKLFDMKLSTKNHVDMKFKFENVEYSLDEIRKSRIVIKNNNGLIYLTRLFREIYPDSIFFALVRNPTALYESHLRRKTPVSITVDSFVNYYRSMVRKMLKDSESIKNYHIIKFEDMIKDPIGITKRLYKLSNLDISEVKKLRFRSKPYMHKGGKHMSKFPAYNHYWFEFYDIPSFFEPNVNTYQLESLDDQTIEKINQSLSEEISQVGYEI